MQASDVASAPDALRQIWLGWLSGATDGGATWFAATPNANPVGDILPRIVIYPRDTGTLRSYIGGGCLWQGEIVVRCIGNDRAAAQAALDAAHAAIPHAASVTIGGTAWAIRTWPVAPIMTAPGARETSAGMRYRVKLEAA